jgi:nucleoid DNA-binding protein
VTDLVYKQKEFIKLVAEESGYYQNAIKDIFDGVEAVLERLMSEANSEDQLEVKIFEGLTVGTKYYPAKKAMNPKTGKKITTDEHIYPVAKYTQGYQNKIREACKDNL